MACEVEKRNGLKIYEGKDDYTDRQYGRCAHPNTVWGRVAPRKVEVHGSAWPLLREQFFRLLSGDFFDLLPIGL